MIQPPPSLCPQCGTALGSSLLACPQCGRLVYSATLKDLAEQADRAQSDGQLPQAILLWKNALAYLPAQAGQRSTIEQNIARLEQAQISPSADKANIDKRSKSWAKWLGILAPAAAFLATKGKFLILGLTKLPTLFSMLLFLSAYWETWGWAFALGFMLSIYVHEMGHAVALNHYGIPASAPFFIPGFGAIIFAKQNIASPSVDARVGLAGPAAGLAAALACLALFAVTGNKLFAALTVFGAFINLFNLIPILFLDGSRGFRGLTRRERWIVAATALACAWAFSSSLSLAIALIMAGRQLFWKSRDPDPAPDQLSFASFVVLLVALAALSNFPAPKPEDLRKPVPAAPKLSSAPGIAPPASK
jgi:Zn-dependent protease